MTRIYKQRIPNVQQADRGRPGDDLSFSSLAAPLEGQKGRARQDLIQDSRSRRDLSVLTRFPPRRRNYAPERHEGARRR